MEELFIAKVIDNNDSDEAGKVQIYIPHLMEGMTPSHYPWANQDREFTSFIPEVGEFIWVYFFDPVYKKKPYYRNKVTLKEYNDHAETIGSMSGSYPNIKYIKFDNGVSLALNSSETEISILAGNTEIYISPAGEIIVKGVAGQFNLLTHTHTTGVGPSGPPIIGS